MTQDRTQFLADIIIGFTEDGGLNGWRRITGYKPEQGIRSFVSFIDIEDDDKEYRVYCSTVERGLKRIVSGEIPINTTMLGTIVLANEESDAGYIDAYDADQIIQAGLFGELIYG